MGDLVIATPFLQAASEKYALTLLAKPYALDLQQRFWPRVNVVPFIAPWTAFQHKYRLWGWPWRQMFSLLEQLAGERFDFGLSARWDPRDHLLLTLVRARARLGFPRVGSQIFLSQPLARPDPTAHRFENWRVMAKALGFELPPREKIGQELRREEGGVSSIGSQAARHSTLDTFDVLVHTGAGQPVRVWPLDRYRNLVAHLRQKGFRVQVACDPDQRPWWLDAGESTVAMPHTVTGLFALVDRADAFIGNDSGPGHLVCPPPPRLGVARRQTLPVQALLRLLPLPGPRLHEQFARRGSVGPGSELSGAGLAPGLGRAQNSRAPTRGGSLNFRWRTPNLGVHCPNSDHRKSRGPPAVRNR